MEPNVRRERWGMVWLGMAAGLALLGVGFTVEGAVTGTVYQQRFPNAALIAWLLMGAGSGLMLLGYKCQLARAGVPPNPGFFLSATLGIVAWGVGWGNLRGAIHGLDESVRDVFVFVGVPVALLGWALAFLFWIRWRLRLNPEQRTLHKQMTRPWVIALVAVAIVALAGSVIFHLLVTGQP